MKKIGLTGILLTAAALLLPGAEKAAPVPAMKIAVFDFSTIDTVGQKFYRYTENRMPAMVYNQLTPADYGTIDDRMLGWVRGLEVQATLQERREDRDRQSHLNDRELARRDELAAKILNSPQRSTVIGSEYMIAALGDYPEAFSPVDRRALDDSLLAIELGTQADAMAQAKEKFGKLTGAEPLPFRDPHIWERMDLLLTEWHNTAEQNRTNLHSLVEISLVTYRIRWTLKRVLSMLIMEPCHMPELPRDF